MALTPSSFTQNLERAQSCLKLVGPAGGKVARSQFILIPVRGLWHWTAFEADGTLHMVVEVAFNRDLYVNCECDTRMGALWTIRDIAATYTAK